MNRKQKTCLLVGISAIVVMGLYPPWVIQTREKNSIDDYKYTTEPGPYSWIGSPPQGSEVGGIYSQLSSAERPHEARARFIDLYRLGVQFFMVAVVTAGLIITFRDEKATTQ